MEVHELLMTALRGFGVYALMLVVIRITGKRSVGNFTAFDLLVALMLGEVVDEIIYGDVTFAQGSVAIVAIAMAQYANSWLSYWKHGFDRILEGVPTILVKDGKLQRDGMRKERMNEKEVMAELRHQQIEDIREVKLALVENDGVVSVIRHKWAEPIQKADLGGEHAKEKERATGGKDDPPASRRTDAKKMIE